MKKALIFLSIPIAVLVFANILLAGNESHKPTKIHSPLPTEWAYKTPTPTQVEMWRGSDELPTPSPAFTETPTASPTAEMVLTPTLTETPVVTPTSEVKDTSQKGSDAPLTNDTTTLVQKPCVLMKIGDVTGIKVNTVDYIHGTIILSWNPIENADTVNIQYSEEDGNWRYSKNDVRAKDLHTDIKGLIYGTHYFFQIQGRNGCSYGTWSTSIDP